MNSPKVFKITTIHQIVFWVLYFLFNTYRWAIYHHDFDYSLKTNLIGFPIHITLCYLTIFVLMPMFLYKRKYVLFILLLLLSIFIMVLAKYNLTYFLVSQNVWPEGPDPISKLTTNYVIHMMIGELYVVTFVTAIKTTLDWLKEHQKLLALERAQMETELLFLRSQMSPHFFFNTLNNIYSLSLQESKKTPQVILKLSELMRYLLYETKQHRQTLENEIFCIQNYIELERIRLGERLDIELNISGDMEDKEIAPMLLLPFIENAFKHGAYKETGEVKITIDVDIQDDILYFKVINPIPKKYEGFSDKKLTKKSGIGLKNVQKRLELGYEKEDYDLKINHTESNFIVELKIRVYED